MMELISNIFPKISMMLGALVIVCLLCGSALAAVRWTFYKWERLIRMHDGIMILFEYRDHRDEFLAWREEQKKIAGAIWPHRNAAAPMARRSQARKNAECGEGGETGRDEI